MQMLLCLSIAVRGDVGGGERENLRRGRRRYRGSGGHVRLPQPDQIDSRQGTGGLVVAMRLIGLEARREALARGLDSIPHACKTASPTTPAWTCCSRPNATKIVRVIRRTHRTNLQLSRCRYHRRGRRNAMAKTTRRAGRRCRRRRCRRPPSTQPQPCKTGFLYTGAIQGASPNRGLHLDRRNNRAIALRRCTRCDGSKWSSSPARIVTPTFDRAPPQPAD